MNPLNEKSVLETIEYLELFGEHRMARKLMREFKDQIRESLNKENKMLKKNQVFEGTLVAAGWDRLDHVNQSSLYTQEDEDILLEHGSGIKKFTPFLNQKVRICGDISTNGSEERRIIVKKISRLLHGFTSPRAKRVDEFGNLILPAA